LKKHILIQQPPIIIPLSGVGYIFNSRAYVAF